MFLENIKSRSFHRPRKSTDTGYRLHRVTSVDTTLWSKPPTAAAGRLHATWNSPHAVRAWMCCFCQRIITGTKYVCYSITKNEEPCNKKQFKFVFSLDNSAVNMALPAFAAERRAATHCCGAVAAGCARRRPPSIDICCPHGAQQQTRCTSLLRSNGGTDGHRDTLPLHEPFTAYCGDSVKA